MYSKSHYKYARDSYITALPSTALASSAPWTASTPPIFFDLLPSSSTMPAGTDSYINPRSARGNAGCWSCRFRKKRCQRSDSTTTVCDDCRRFHMECIGSGDERPRVSSIACLLVLDHAAKDYFVLMFISVPVCLKRHEKF